MTFLPGTALVINLLPSCPANPPRRHIGNATAADPSERTTRCRMRHQNRDGAMHAYARTGRSVPHRLAERATGRQRVFGDRREITSDGQGAPVTLGYSESGHQPPGSYGT